MLAPSSAVPRRDANATPHATSPAVTKAITLSATPARTGAGLRGNVERNGAVGDGAHRRAGRGLNGRRAHGAVGREETHAGSRERDPASREPVPEQVAAPLEAAL